MNELLNDALKVKQQFLEGLKDTPIYDRIPNTKVCNVVLNMGMRTTAGRAVYKTNTVILNAKLYLENKEEFRQTIGHELAHLIEKEVYGTSGHGPRWKGIMYMLGLTPKRCHSYKVQVRRHKVKAYAACSCRAEIPLRAVHYNKMLKGATLICTGCKIPIELKG